MLAYNCSPSFNWEANLDRDDIARFQREIGAMGYKFQFVTLAGFHQLNYGMFELARGYRDRGMAAYSELQQAEFAAEPHGYTATRHQREVGTGYFDLIAQMVAGGDSSTTALAESTEAAQFVRAPDTHNEGEYAMSTEPQRSRAVFSTEDFALMKEAIAEHVKRVADDPRSIKFAHLYHGWGGSRLRQSRGLRLRSG